MKHGKPGRHAPAFILLVLSLEPNHGLGILAKMDEIVAGHRLDTAVIYRVLKKLEADGFIRHEWVKSDMGPKKKVFYITSTGQKELARHKDCIEKTILRLQAFIKIYSEL